MLQKQTQATKWVDGYVEGLRFFLYTVFFAPLRLCV